MIFRIGLYLYGNQPEASQCAFYFLGANSMKAEWIQNEWTKSETAQNIQKHDIGNITWLR